MLKMKERSLSGNYSDYEDQREVKNNDSYDKIENLPVKHVEPRNVLSVNPEKEQSNSNKKYITIPIEEIDRDATDELFEITRLNSTHTNIDKNGPRSILLDELETILERYTHNDKELEGVLREIVNSMTLSEIRSFKYGTDLYETNPFLVERLKLRTGSKMLGITSGILLGVSGISWLANSIYSWDEESQYQASVANTVAASTAALGGITSILLLRSAMNKNNFAKESTILKERLMTLVNIRKKGIKFEPSYILPELK
ncbi:hypothetical protein [Enterobacter roggenkampii]|uniref:hypothetical protein n=1 Tax=Enterobacter roggenkampii TaxID=1812935 RepID=UPI00084C58CD|nr:hypothetical protein [Enterobacter roggenkampii]AOP98031.1 hypothetical protein BFV67_22935 [Enterobacter roggenkampii]QWZ75369.1 hypothetical protein I6L60_23025 [Enterobacter roggenkampii]